MIRTAAMKSLVLTLLVVGSVNSAYFIPISSSLLQENALSPNEKPIFETPITLTNYNGAPPGERSIAAYNAHVVNTMVAAEYAGQVTKPTGTPLRGFLDSYGDPIGTENLEFGRRYFRSSPERLFDDGSYRDDAREKLFDDGSYREEWS